MSSKTCLVLVSVLLASAGLVHADNPAPANTVPVPESIIARHVPAIPQAGIEDLLPYENLRTAALAAWHPKERRMLIRTRFSESVQLHEVAMPMGDRTQLTFYKDPVAEGEY
ncbi:MAG TPA: S9 family peptidase, partial [Thermoanaerobaculia bacterium]|nr:S9 family peptidase [Thermoanaerobaculia bacterium]